MLHFDVLSQPMHMTLKSQSLPLNCAGQLFQLFSCSQIVFSSLLIFRQCWCNSVVVSAADREFVTAQMPAANENTGADLKLQDRIKEPIKIDQGSAMSGEHVWWCQQMSMMECWIDSWACSVINLAALQLRPSARRPARHALASRQTYNASICIMMKHTIVDHRMLPWPASAASLVASLRLHFSVLFSFASDIADGQEFALCDRNRVGKSHQWRKSKTAKTTSADAKTICTVVQHNLMAISDQGASLCSVCGETAKCKNISKCKISSTFRMWTSLTAIGKFYSPIAQLNRTKNKKTTEREWNQ